MRWAISWEREHSEFLLTSVQWRWGLGWERGHSPGKGVSRELVVGVDMVASRSNLQITGGLRALWSQGGSA